MKRSYSEVKAKAHELAEFSLFEIAETMLDLEENVENKESIIETLDGKIQELRDAYTG